MPLRCFFLYPCVIFVYLNFAVWLCVPWMCICGESEASERQGKSKRERAREMEWCRLCTVAHTTVSLNRFDSVARESCVHMDTPTHEHTLTHTHTAQTTAFIVVAVAVDIQRSKLLLGMHCTESWCMYILMNLIQVIRINGELVRQTVFADSLYEEHTVHKTMPMYVQTKPLLMPPSKNIHSLHGVTDTFIQHQHFIYIAAAVLWLYIII